MPAWRGRRRRERALLRIDMPQGAPPAGSMVQVGDGAEAMRLKVLGPATSGDAQLQTAGVLALAEGARAARASVGRVLAARIESAGGQAGVLVPRAAIVRADGRCSPIAPPARMAMNAWR
jgi:hypothetical protein